MAAYPTLLVFHLYQLAGIMVPVSPWVVVYGYRISGRKTINSVNCLNTKTVKPQTVEDSYSTRFKGHTVHYLRGQPKDLLLATMFKDVMSTVMV